MLRLLVPHCGVCEGDSMCEVLSVCAEKVPTGGWLLSLLIWLL